MQPSILWSSSVSLFVIEMMAIIHSLKCTVPFSFAVPLLSLDVTHCHLLSFVVTDIHSLSLVLPLVVTCCHSLSFVVTRCTTRCHLLSLVVPLVVTRCHSLSRVVTRCTIRLSFYKWSNKSLKVIIRIQYIRWFMLTKYLKRKCYKTFMLFSQVFSTRSFTWALLYLRVVAWQNIDRNWTCCS